MNKQDKKTIILLSTISLIGVIGILVYANWLNTQVARSSALESAGLYSSALSEFRTIYTQKVISKLQKHPGIVITHAYQDDSNAIPLPATLSMELGENIGKHQSGEETYLYSPILFPDAKQRVGLRTISEKRLGKP